MSLTLSYFLICIVTALYGNISMAVMMVAALLAVTLLVFSIMKKYSLVELLRSMPIAVLSVACSWLFLRFGL